MKTETREIYCQGLQVREAEAEGESRTIEGCAIVFDRETTLYDGKYYKLREIISREAVTEDFLKTQDIKLNLLHNREDSVARNNKGEGTLQLEIREDGLYFRAEMPKCDIGDRCLALVRNKTYTGCSFEFIPDKYTEDIQTDADGREDCLVKHTAFRQIQALTIAMDPAYKQTSVAEAREHDNQIESEKRESEARQKAEQARKQQIESLRRAASYILTE